MEYRIYMFKIHVSCIVLDNNSLKQKQNKNNKRKFVNSYENTSYEKGTKQYGSNRYFNIRHDLKLDRNFV